MDLLLILAFAWSAVQRGWPFAPVAAGLALATAAAIPVTIG